MFLQSNDLRSQYGTFIFNPHGAIIRKSKNLRGMRYYARVSRVSKVEAKQNPANNVRGVLRVTYLDGCYSIADFASYSIMIDFIRNRKSWRNAGLIIEGPNIGYLTKPGIIAGE